MASRSPISRLPFTSATERYSSKKIYAEVRTDATGRFSFKPKQPVHLSRDDALPLVARQRGRARQPATPIQSPSKPRNEIAPMKAKR